MLHVSGSCTKLMWGTIVKGPSPIICSQVKQTFLTKMGLIFNPILMDWIGILLVYSIYTIL